MSRRLLLNATRVAAVSGLVGIALLLQESALAYRFGVDDQFAAFQVAFLWISLLWNVLAGGTLLQVLVPTHVWARTRFGADTATASLGALFGWLLSAMVILSVALAIAVPVLYASPLGGLNASVARLSGLLFVLMTPTFVMQTLAAIAQAHLNIEGRFALAAFTPIFSPLAAIAATLWFAKDLGVLATAGGIVAGQFLQASVLLVALRRQQPIRLRGISLLANLPAVRTFFASYGMLVAAALLLSGVFWVDQAAAAHQGPQAIAQLAYANRPVFLFAALATVAVANVALPGFTEDASRKNHQLLRRQLARGIFWIGATSAIALPLWGLFAPEVVGLLYQRGAFTQEDTASVAILQRWALAQVPFYLIAVLAWRMLNALKANGVVMAATGACCAVNAALVIPLSEIFGVPGIFAGTTAAFALWSLVLVLAARRLLR